MGLALGHHIPGAAGFPTFKPCEYIVKFDGPSPYSPVLRFRYDVRYRPDGKRVWIRTGGTSHPSFDNLHQYDITPAWNLAGGWTLTGQLSQQNDTFVRTMDWHDNGTKLTFLNRWFSGFRRMDTFDQSATPYDISGGLGPIHASRTGIPGAEFLVRWNLETSAGGLESGDHVFNSRLASLLVKYVCTTPHDISTMNLTPVQVFDGSPFGARFDLATFNADHTKIYCQQGGFVASFDLTAPDDISAPFNFQTGILINPVGPPTLGVARGWNVRPDTGDLIIHGDQNNYRFRCFGGVLGITQDPNFSDVVLLLDFAGIDGAQAITDLSNSAHTETFFDNAQVDTARRFLGQNSLLLDGVDDEITYPTSPDWDFGTGDFTVEFGAWLDVNTTLTMLSNFDGASDGWWIQSLQSGGQKLVVGYGASALLTVTWVVPGSPHDHIAVVRQGTTLTVYQEGVSLGSVSDSTDFSGSTAALRIGSKDGLIEFMDGSIGGVRITKGLARYTAPFTPPVCFYPSAGP